MNYYNLVSCTPSVYPDLGPFHHPTAHPYAASLVYVNGTPSRTYTLTAATFSAGSTALPTVVLSPYSTCSQTEHLYNLCNAVTGEETVYLFGSAQTVGNYLRFANSCDIYEIKAHDGTAPTVQAGTVDQVYTNVVSALNDLQYVTCELAEVAKRYAVRAAMPDAGGVDRGFNECCFELKVLADTADSAEYKNDYTSVFYTKQTAGDSVAFKLVDVSTATVYNLNGGTYGVLTTFGDTTAYRLEWRDVLIALGTGHYQIRKDITTAGVTTQVLSNTYHLYNYSTTAADKTIKIESGFNGRFESLGTNFDDYNTSIRLPGFFGRPEPTFTQDNIMHGDYTMRQVTASVENEYQLQTNLLPSCITKEVLYFMLLADDIKITDYNLNNHRYDLIQVPVLLQDNAGTGYHVRSRDAVLNLTFVDKLKNTFKRNC